MPRNSTIINLEESYVQRYSEVDIFSTQGRIGSKTYFIYSIVIPFIFFSIISSIAGALTHLGSTTTLVSYAFLALATVAVLFILVRLTIQRCHDFNSSSWYSVFAIIPFANIIFALIPGDNGLNQYGEVPKPASVLGTIVVGILIVLLITLVVFSLLYYFDINIRAYI